VAREHVKEVTVAERFGQEVVAAGIEHFLTFLGAGVGGDGEDGGFRLHGQFAEALPGTLSITVGRDLKAS
jgi:hypothetical protein